MREGRRALGSIPTQFRVYILVGQQGIKHPCVIDSVIFYKSPVSLGFRALAD